jgi:hypothetical protein
MRRRISILILICIAAFPVTLLYAQSDIAEKQTIKMEPYDSPDVSSRTGYGNCQWFYPLDEPNETLLSEPNYASDKQVYYAAEYGDATDNIHTLVIDESEGTGKGYDTLYVDIDNDNRLDPNAEKFSFQLGTTRRTVPARITLTVTAGGEKIPYSFNFSAFPYTDKSKVEKIHANARNSTIFTGEATFGGKACKIAIADLDSNGLFNNVEKGIFRGDRFFVDLSGDDEFRDPPQDKGPKEGFPYSQYVRIDGKWYCVEASPSGTTIGISPAEPELTTIMAQKEITKVTLFSDTQAQSLMFSDGSAEAITGTYELAGVELSITDANERKWTCRGSFRTDRPEVIIAAGVETRIADILPLQVSIEPTGECPSSTITLEPKITGADGGTYRCPYAVRPAGSFEIQDEQGQVVHSSAFEYG